MVEITAATLRDEKYTDASRAQELRTVDLDESQIASLKESLDRNATGYSDAAFQFQKIGNNVNQLARSANSGDRVPAAALEQVSRRLARIEESLALLADDDGARSTMLRRWL
ncbi:MobC family plasmid mobilization relaxosome protein [Brevibacterium sp. S111]|uniref:MobC family plasmid mobilization relaxosome protein n=1 Tax=Brevibacterium sp. S111 TaxID=2483795 RepID=UPI0014368021|nr:MobC family plasmid mobilization relaxosome protein [Brevibacterium sp. S111]